MSDAGRQSVCVFGEVLFDHLPDGRRILGGGPDAEGAEVRRAMRDWGMDTSGLQCDEALPTGSVRVSLDSNGEPDYEIYDKCAYDAIEVPQAPHFALLYHGTLAARHGPSATALRTLRAGGHGATFVDVNLRAPYWTRERALDLVRGAHWVKLNVDELRSLTDRSGGAGRIARQLLQQYELRGLLVTSGADGAELLLADGSSMKIAPRKTSRVVDTVGAGDAFAAVMLLGLLRQWPLQQTIERSQEFAGSIVQQRGATVGDREFYARFVNAWQLAEEKGGD